MSGQIKIEMAIYSSKWQSKIINDDKQLRNKIQNIKSISQKCKSKHMCVFLGILVHPFFG